MSECLGDGFHAESNQDPETRELLDFLDIYKQIQEALGWLVEAGANAPLLKGMKRAQLHYLMQQIGLDPSDPNAFSQLEELKRGLTDRTQHPKPRIEVPEVGFFESRIKEIVAEHERFGSPPSMGYAVQDVADLSDVARLGHTDWRTVRSRSGKDDTAKWIHGVARIMADPIAYHAEFGGLGTATRHRSADPLTICEDWSIQNGRHRSLAAASLGEPYILEAGMAQWIPVTVESSE